MTEFISNLEPFVENFARIVVAILELLGIIVILCGAIKVYIVCFTLLLNIENIILKLV